MVACFRSLGDAGRGDTNGAVTVGGHGGPGQDGLTVTSRVTLGTSTSHRLPVLSRDATLGGSAIVSSARRAHTVAVGAATIDTYHRPRRHRPRPYCFRLLQAPPIRLRRLLVTCRPHQATSAADPFGGTITLRGSFFQGNGRTKTPMVACWSPRSAYAGRG